MFGVWDEHLGISWVSEQSPDLKGKAQAERVRWTFFFPANVKELKRTKERPLLFVI
jgi:hypothetical protein